MAPDDFNDYNGISLRFSAKMGLMFRRLAAKFKDLKDVG